MKDIKARHETSPVQPLSQIESLEEPKAVVVKEPEVVVEEPEAEADVVKEPGSLQLEHESPRKQQMDYSKICESQKFGDMTIVIQEVTYLVNLCETIQVL